MNTRPLTPRHRSSTRPHARRLLSGTALLLAGLLAGFQAAPPPGAPTRASSSGRPPTDALARSSPRAYDVTFITTIFTDTPYVDGSLRQRIAVRDAPFVLPMVVRGPWSRSEIPSLTGRIFVDGVLQRGAADAARVEHNKPFGMAYAILPLAAANAQTIKFEIGFRTQTWSSSLDEARAAQATWPQEWPVECADALKPQLFIESEDPRFRQFVERVSGGALRQVPPHLAAKDLVRATIGALRISGNGLSRVEGGVMQGMALKGAAQAMADGTGTPHDLVASCVAVLRAAGIPARVVVGVDRSEVQTLSSGLLSWGEYYLPGSGWVPFDPNLLRGSAIARKGVRDPWPNFGTMKDLNRRIILSYAFQPPGALISHGYPAVYGWDPRPSGAPASTRQYVNVNTTSRGEGTPDPE